jgi:hypothetical protein
MLKKKIWANFQRIVKVFTQKIFNMLLNICVWDPGSEIRDLEKTYSGSRIQGSKRHRIPDPDSSHCVLSTKFQQILVIFMDRMLAKIVYHGEIFFSLVANQSINHLCL